MNVNIPSRKDEALDLGRDELARLRITLAPHMDAAGRVWMPKVDKLWMVSRDAAICSTRDRYSIRDQAFQYRLSSRHITNIRRKGADDGVEQMDLF